MPRTSSVTAYRGAAHESSSVPGHRQAAEHRDAAGSGAARSTSRTAGVPGPSSRPVPPTRTRGGDDPGGGEHRAARARNRWTVSFARPAAFSISWKSANEGCPSSRPVRARWAVPRIAARALLKSWATSWSALPNSPGAVGFGMLPESATGARNRGSRDAPSGDALPGHRSPASAPGRFVSTSPNVGSPRPVRTPGPANGSRPALPSRTGATLLNGGTAGNRLVRGKPGTSLLRAASRERVVPALSAIESPIAHPAGDPRESMSPADPRAGS